MIRHATVEDRPRLVAMGKRFVAETAYREFLAINPERLGQTIDGLFAMDDMAAIFVSGPDSAPTGMIALMAYDHPFTGERVGSELVWWVEPEARGDGVRLLRAAENWARKAGCQKIQMIAPTERMENIYRRMGYVPVETAFQRSL